MSNFARGYSDFDANYKIYTTIESRLANNLELWNILSEFQEIIKNYSGVLRKILIVAKQYENNMDYLNTYKTYIMASWVSNDKNASNFRVKACQLFADKILPNYNNNLLQIVDILRMEGSFDNAIKLIGAVKGITDESDEKLLKIIDAEIEFIKNKDLKRHNLSEIFE